jgi:transcriptional regulator GlxA family with amidase domain
LEELKAAAPGAVIMADERVVDNGQIIIAAGVAAGIDMSLHVVARLLGEATAAETAKYIEYNWPSAG